MQRVIVTVRRADETRLRDLELPADIDAGQLANIVAEALRWQSNPQGAKASYTIEAHPLGRTMQPNETLAGASVWDGSWLVFHPVPTPVFAPTPSPLPPPPPAAPLPQPYSFVAPEQVAPAQPGALPAGNFPVASDPGVRSNLSSNMPQPSAPTVIGWRSLGLDIPVLPPVEQAQLPPQTDLPPSVDKPKSSSFVWKQIDE